jgi:competence protein ComEA
VLRLVRGDLDGSAGGAGELPPEPPDEVVAHEVGDGADGDGTGGGGAAARSDLGALRERAVAAAVRGYTATHGHPLDHATSATSGPTRWAVSTRVAFAAVVALAIPVAAVVVRSWRSEPVTVLAVTEPDGRAGPETSDGGTEVQGGPAGPAAAGDGVPAESADAATDAVADSVPGAVPGASEVVVHVVGQVARPGVFVLASGSRVADAVTAAGGATGEADLAAVNLARAVVDGEQILVPRPGETVPGDVPAQAGAPPASTDAALVDLNSAQVADLDQLPGIGPVLAQRIVDWRTEHGRFSTVDELAEVRGIGPSLMADLRAVVRV